MLRHEVSCPKGRLLLGLLMLKDASCDHYAVPGIDQVVSHESRHLADDGHEAFLAQLRHLLRVSHTLVAPHCNVHSFSLPPSYPAFSHTSGLMLSTDEHDASRHSSAHLAMHYLLQRSAERSSENFPSRDCLETKLDRRQRG